MISLGLELVRVGGSSSFQGTHFLFCRFCYSSSFGQYDTLLEAVCQPAVQDFQ